jgi:3(or 17)beta-hydroxysteroid dehydrogenase
MSGRLAGKTAIITGAAGGFGTAMTDRMLREGAFVVATDLDVSGIAPQDALLPIAHDVTDEAGWKSVIDAAVRKFGRVDVLVNNAGISQTSGLQDPEHIDIGQWRAISAVNVEGVILGCQAAIKTMKGHGGSIINFSSIAALDPTPRMLAYGASKAAVLHITRTVAAYCAKQAYNIRCNSIHPGWFPTAMTMSSRTPAEMAAQELAVPLKRFGTAAEIASAVLYLASDEAAYLTGTRLVIDGGVSMA